MRLPPCGPLVRPLGLLLLSLAGSTAHAQEPTPREAEERGIAPHTWPAPALRGSAGLDLRTLEGGVVIMPSSGTGGTNAIAVFDAETGDLIDGAAIPFPEGGLGTTVQAIMNFEGDGLFISSQTHHVVYEIGLDGEFRGVFAPHGGVDFDILHNIRGITLSPSGDRLWVTVANGSNEGAIAEFDQEGNYVGNFIEPAGSPMTSPWSISVRDQEILISDSGADGIHRFQLDGTYVGLFNQTGLTFPQQVLELENGHVVTAVFSSSGPSGIHEFAADGTFIDLYTAVTGVRGVYELPNGNFLVSDAFGLHEITRQNELVRTIMTGQSRFLTLLPPSNLTFTPSTLQGEATIDTTAPGGFTMRNNTPQALAFEILDVPPFVNAISPGAGTLGPGASTGISLTFDASGLPLGVYHGTILVQTDEAEDNLYEYPVVLTVVGIPECAIEPDPVAFGEVIVGSSSSLPVSVSNQSGGPCTLESAIIDGDEFSSDFTGPVMVAPGDTFTFEVAFTPSAAGPFTGTLTLVTGGDEPAVTAQLSGTGIAPPEAAVNPTALDFVLAQNGTASASVTLSNEAAAGAADLDFTVSIGAVSPDRSEIHLRSPDTAAMGGQPVRPAGAVRPGRDGPSGGVEAATRALVAAGIEPIGGAPPLPVIPPADQGHPIDNDWHEGFEDITLLPAAGWAMQNNSQPLGLTGWLQGHPNVFPAHAGPVNSYIRANFENVAGAGEISNWLMTPEIVLENGTELRFWTRTTEQFQNYNDRLEVRLSTAGGSTNVGAMATSVGDFDELLLSINPDLLPNVYPEEWTEYVIVLDGIPSGTTGRFAFRYWVTNAGAHGDFGDYIGIDEVSLTYTGPTMVSVVPAQGAVSAASSQDLTVSINAEGAEEGTYNFELLIQTNDPENALLTVSVSVQVTEQVPAQAGVDPLSLQFELSPTDLPSAWQVVTLSNLASHGAADLQFELSFGDGSDAERGAAPAAASLYMAPARVADPAVPARAPDARVQLGSEAVLEGRVYRPRAITDPSGMLGVEPASGIVAPGEALEIMVTAYCDDDDDFGTYTFDLLVHTNAPDNPVIVVQIEIVVSETIAADGNPASDVFDLEPNHPNPFSDRTTIAYSLAEASHVLLTVYDLSGRRVATLVDLEQAAGRHSATWDASGLAAGIYFYRIRAGEFTGTMRALVVR